MAASDAVELAVRREAEPRTHALSAHREEPVMLVVHAGRCCPHGGEVLGYYTPGQAAKMLRHGDELIVPCSCVLTAARVALVT